MSDPDLILAQLQQMRAENSLRHEEVLGRFDRLKVHVSSLEERVSVIEMLLVRQQRHLYELIDRLEQQH